MRYHAPGHGILVSCVIADLDTLDPAVMTVYSCEDPTCDWHITEVTGGPVNRENLNLTCEICNGTIEHPPSDAAEYAARHQARLRGHSRGDDTQYPLFGESRK